MGCVPWVTGVPSGAETAGSLMELSLARWGSAAARPAKRTAMTARDVIISNDKKKSWKRWPLSWKLKKGNYSSFWAKNGRSMDHRQWIQWKIHLNAHLAEIYSDKEKERKKRTKMRIRRKGVKELWLATPGILYWDWPWEDRDRHGDRHTDMSLHNMASVTTTYWLQINISVT